jgi:zinc resistance-associated protein
LIFIGESLSSPFRYQQDLSAEIMPCFRAAKPALKHIACALASKNDSPVPGGTGHFYSLFSLTASAGLHGRAFSGWHERCNTERNHTGENAMKRNRTLPLALVTLAALTFGSNTAWANHHWGNNKGIGNQGYSQLTQEQQATAQKLHNDYYEQTSALRQQLQSKRYEYNALLTAQKPDSGKIEAVAQEMEGLRQKLDQQRVKLDLALAEAGVPRGAGMGYGGCRGSGGGHMGMNHW